jgi:hypothetical protein
MLRENKKKFIRILAQFLHLIQRTVKSQFPAPSWIQHSRCVQYEWHSLAPNVLSKFPLVQIVSTRSNKLASSFINGVGANTWQVA